jgi:2-oxoglutarate dehydrogenase E2 component (dihydrolipoamide succinyltransferase)
MATVEMVMPKMGESIMEGTILNWLKKVGDKIEQDESVLEVATDKVDTEVPAPFAGTIQEILAQKGDVVQVGKAIAIINTSSSVETIQPIANPIVGNSQAPTLNHHKEIINLTDTNKTFVDTKETTTAIASIPSNESRFYSPLVLNITRQEGISMVDLEKIIGTGRDGRVTKNDILDFLKQKEKTNLTPQKIEWKEIKDLPQFQSTSSSEKIQTVEKQAELSSSIPNPISKPSQSVYGRHEIIEMDRMRKMIAERMLDSRRTSAHVTSFVEADVTNIVYWRNRMKQDFMQKEGLALTFTPIFIEAVIKALKDYPLMNASVEGDKIIVKKDINIGVAVALANNNLIVPVIKNADDMNIVGLTKKINDIAKRARANKITPDELQGGTYTISNVGSFGNVMGTPILVQPQVGILALGTVVKKPAVIETEQGDTIGIRHMMFLSHSYDHRIIDGALGGMFVRRVADYLEQFDLSRKVF